MSLKSLSRSRFVARPSTQQRMKTAALLVVHTLATIYLTRTLFPTTGTTTSISTLQEPSSVSSSSSSSSSASSSWSSEDLKWLLDRKHHDFSYMPQIDLLVMSMGKTGSTSLFRRLYTGLTNLVWDAQECGYVANKSSACWNKHAYKFETLTEAQQHFALTSNTTIRLAVQRDPFDRLISAFKSKYTCDDALFNTDLSDRIWKVPALRKLADLPHINECMNISEFSLALDIVRMRIGRPYFSATKMAWLDSHVRPQRYFFDRIDYNLVWDVKDLSNVTATSILMKRLPFAKRVARMPSVIHPSSNDGALVIPEHDAQKLVRFAALSHVGPPRYHGPPCGLAGCRATKKT